MEDAPAAVAARDPRPWLNWRAAPRAPFRLVCFPHAGAAASMFREWDRRLGPHIDVLAAQLPGRENRIAEPAFDSLEPLVDAVLDGLLVHLDRPYAVFGHSMGALLGYALTRRLADTGGPRPEVLFVSGYPAPHLPTGDDDDVHRLDDDALVARMRDYAGTPPEVLDDPELARMLLPTIRADFEVCETYTHVAGPPLPIDIVAFAGRADAEAPPESMVRWFELGSAAFALHCVDGGHFFLEQSLGTVLDLVAARCQASSSDHDVTQREEAPA
jgi:surfactin synthase thioesterase subunit